MMITGLLMAALLQQPQQPQPRPVPSAAQVQQSVTPIPHSAFDSTVAAVSDVGTKVAELRTSYDLYRRAVFNEPDGAVVQRATAYGTKCRALATAALQAQRHITPGSVSADARPALVRYRENLPSLNRLGQSCGNRMQQLKTRGDERAVASALRNDVQAQGNQLAQGLTSYEARLHDVRVVMGWEAAAPGARRPGR